MVVAEVSCAICHSRASAMDFMIISIQEKVLFSKHRLFLAFHKFHRIHGHKGIVSPTGGRLINDGASDIREAIDVMEVVGIVTKGARLQTCSAMLQLRKT